MNRTIARLLVITTFLFFVFWSPVKTSAQDQNPVPSNTQIECNNVSNTEFNSLRPYQANTQCTSTTAPEATFCGNELTIKETITRDYPGDGNCTIKGSSAYCNFVVKMAAHTVKIKLDQAELPFMGNTEDVINSKNTDTSKDLTNAEKMNGYVSWYLNGVLNRAEYPLLSVPDDNSKSSDAVNYSGPLNKLLPKDVQILARNNSVNNAKETHHDQIVGCSYTMDYTSFLNVFPLIGLDIGVMHIVDLPTPCYTDFNFWQFLLETGLKVEKQTRRLSDWEGHLPPVRSDYTDFAKYLRDYREWQGKDCILFSAPSFVPVIGGKRYLLCFPSLTKEKFYSNMYQYIPYASTEDAAGSVDITAASPSPSNTAVVSSVNFSGQQPAQLFFAHMVESDKEASLLQGTYAAKGQDLAGDPTNITKDTFCKSVEVRSNAGDSLFAGEISGDLSYTASFSCVFKVGEEKFVNGPICNNLGGRCVENDWNCNSSYGNLDCGSGFKCGVSCSAPSQTQTCSVNVYINLSTKTKVPLVDEVWSRLVAGPMSVFKRMFPKTNTEGSVGQIMDIPGSTNITYSVSSSQVGNVKVEGSSTNTDLKIPHVGGISEYFLKGIQTALRPKGFGDPISFANVPITSASCSNGITTMPTLPAAGGTCVLGKTSQNIPPTMKAIIEAAAQTYNVPPGLIVGIMYGEGLFDGQNKRDWTEENVKDWATCGKVPSCNESGYDNFIGFTDSSWADPQRAILPELQKLDPSKKTADRCNLLDAIYGLAWNLHDSADGATSAQAPNMPLTCFGINLKAPVPISCSWTNEQYESAIKVHESGYTSACFTAAGSCAGGGGMSAACPNSDSCETITNRYPNPSHNACVWDVAHGN